MVRSPGRVNLIGEHTDYNDGFVLPMAIDRWVWLAVRPRTDGRVNLHSANLEAEAAFALHQPGIRGAEWVDYARGVSWALEEDSCRLEGFDGLVWGDVPVGAGLSSSAAFTMAVARAFAAVSDLAWDPLRMARAGQRAENDWIGVSCGIMDPLISAGARTGHATLIDCRTLDLEPVPVFDEMAVVVLDTSTRRELAHSEYNERRAQCAAAAAACGALALRDVTDADLGRSGPGMNHVAFRRARHVVTENVRVLQARDALLAQDAGRLGRLMDESHESLRSDFEVSTVALDAMVASARRAPGCHGARLTGAGFGGCVVASVARDRLDSFLERVLDGFTRVTGLLPVAYRCEAVGGAEVLPLGG